jgi:DNA-binding MarR family transcriptional regulator
MQSSVQAHTGVSVAEPTTAEEAVMVSMMALGRKMRQRHPGDQIDFSAIPMLKTLKHNGPMRLSALAGHLGLDASTVSRQARQFEGRGLLERTGDPEDGRASRVALSEHGARCLEEGADARRAMIASILDGWPSEDRERLRTLLTRFYTDLIASQETS